MEAAPLQQAWDTGTWGLKSSAKHRLGCRHQEECTEKEGMGMLILHPERGGCLPHPHGITHKMAAAHRRPHALERQSHSKKF